MLCRPYWQDCSHPEHRTDVEVYEGGLRSAWDPRTILQSVYCKVSFQGEEWWDTSRWASSSFPEGSCQVVSSWKCSCWVWIWQLWRVDFTSLLVFIPSCFPYPSFHPSGPFPYPYFLILPSIHPSGPLRTTNYLRKIIYWTRKNCPNKGIYSIVCFIRPLIFITSIYYFIHVTIVPPWHPCNNEVSFSLFGQWSKWHWSGVCWGVVWCFGSRLRFCSEREWKHA